MNIVRTVVPGCYEVEYIPYSDARGTFVKTFQRSKFQEYGMEVDFVEEFYTHSSENVLRGMHFQLPPSDGAKLIRCLSGSVMDVALDLRRGSPAYGEAVAIELSTSKFSATYIPAGVAHGFYVRQAPALLLYSVTAEHNPSLDTGIAWNSFGFPWPCRNPLLSPRDAALPTLQSFNNPFTFAG